MSEFFSDLGDVFTYGVKRRIDAEFAEPVVTVSDPAANRTSSEGTGAPVAQGKANAMFTQNNLLIGGAVLGAVVLAIWAVR